jgi:hypothetical protein
MALSVVKTNNAGQTATSTTVIMPAMSNTTGNLIVVCACAIATGNPIIGVTDTAGNTYVPLTAITQTTTGLQYFYAKNITGNAANVVTVTWTITAGFRAAYAWEISGADIVNPLDQQIGGTGTTGTSATSSAFTTTSANEIILAAVSTNVVNETFSAGGVYVLDSAGYPAGATLMFNGAEHLITSTIQTGVTASMTWTSAVTGWTIAVATFKAASGSGGSTPTLTDTRILFNNGMNALSVL